MLEQRQLIRIVADRVAQLVHEVGIHRLRRTTRAGSRIADAICSRVRRGVRYWLSFSDSGSPRKRAQSPTKSERIVSTT